MKNKKIVILLILIILLVVTSLIPMPAFAAADLSEDGSGQLRPSNDQGSSLSLDNILQGADNFIVQGQGQQDETINQDQLHSTVNFLYQLFAGVGLVVATVVGIIIGIKLMMAASSDEKAHYKHQLIAYVIGVVVIVGAIGIWQLVVAIMNNADPDEAEYTKPEPGTVTNPIIEDSSEDSETSSTAKQDNQSQQGTSTNSGTGTNGQVTTGGNSNVKEGQEKNFNDSGKAPNSGTKAGSDSNGSRVTTGGDSQVHEGQEKDFGNDGKSPNSGTAPGGGVTTGGNSSWHEAQPKNKTNTGYKPGT